MVKLGKQRRHAWTIAATLVLQGLVGAFCAVPASAHAVPQATMIDDCLQSSATVKHPSSSDSRRVCAHCDLPDEAAGGMLPTVADGASPAITPHAFARRPQPHGPTLRTRTPAPPGSAHLLVSTTSRLRI